jgi:hypothetical protein
MSQLEMVTFGSYVGIYSEGASSTEGSNPFLYTQDGIFWKESELPFYIGESGESVELNASLYMVSLQTQPGDGEDPLRVATTADGVDWTELSVRLPVPSNVDSNFSSSSFELEAFANQIWLFGSFDNRALLLKSSDGATWDEVATPAWETSADGVETVSTPDRLVVLASLGGGDGTYVWSTADGSNWTQSSAVIPSSGSMYGVEMAYANGALWTFGTPDGEMYQALYNSTDWGNSWSQVTTNLPTIEYDIKLMALAPSPGLLISFSSGTYISGGGSEWSRISSYNYAYTMYNPLIEVSSTGKFWMSYYGFYSVGGPLRNGRFFYYQKD